MPGCSTYRARRYETVRADVNGYQGLLRNPDDWKYQSGVAGDGQYHRDGDEYQSPRIFNLFNTRVLQHALYLSLNNQSIITYVITALNFITLE